jgi:hypothetical protein
MGLKDEECAPRTAAALAIAKRWRKIAVDAACDMTRGYLSARLPPLVKPVSKSYHPSGPY